MDASQQVTAHGLELATQLDREQTVLGWEMWRTMSHELFAWLRGYRRVHGNAPFVLNSNVAAPESWRIAVERHASPHTLPRLAKAFGVPKSDVVRVKQRRVAK